MLIWQYSTRKIKFRLSEHDHAVQIVKFSHDDKLLMSIGNFMDRKIFIWDTSNGYIVGSLVLKSVAVAACWGGHVRDLK